MAKKTTAPGAAAVAEKINPDLAGLIRPIDSLTIDPKNTRKHGSSDLAALAESIRKHGQQKPIVVSPSGKVIAGNGTLQAARDILGWKNIAATTFDGDSEAAAVAFAITDNRVAELSSWDFDELRSAIGSLEQADIDGLGFSPKELAALLNDVEQSKTVDVTNHTREITDLKAPTTVCPKCGFEFDE